MTLLSASVPINLWYRIINLHIKPKPNIVCSLRFTQIKIEKKKQKNEKATSPHLGGSARCTMLGSVEGAESPLSAGASEAASTPVSEGASTTRDGLGSGRARDDIGAASSLPSVSASCSKLSALAVGAMTRGIEVTPSSTVVVPTAAEVTASSSMVVPTAIVVAASAGDDVAALSTGGCVVAASASAGGAASRPPCIVDV